MAAPTPKQLAGCQRRSIRAMRERLLAMAAEWADLDEYNASLLEEAARQLPDVHADDPISEDGSCK